MKIINMCLLIVLITFVFMSQSLADGFIVIPRPNPLPDPFPLEVVYHKVNVEINGQTAVTKIDQSFYNPSHHQLEGFYIFPVPKGAVINNFTMFINGTETKAELLDAVKARKIYEDIVRQMRDPALLEYSEQNIFKLRIFPIEPKSEKKLSISYTQILESDNAMFEYIYPLNTEKFSARPLKNISVKVELKSEERLKNIYCPTHEADIVHKGDYHSVISYEDENIKPDADFKLYFGKNASRIGLSVFTYKKNKDDGYFFLSASPSLDINKNQIEEKDLTFIVDVSGSMIGNKIEQAKKALLYCVNNLNDGDRFEIIRFSTEAYALFNGLKSATKSNRNKAKEFIEELKAIGGTNIEEAFQSASKNNHKSGRPHFIIFLTDGKPTIGETNDDKLLKNIIKLNPGNTRIFTFGIGNEINTHLLDRMTEETKAYRTYIGEKEDIEIKVSNFYDKIQSPVLSDLKITFEPEISVSKLYPKNLPDLFKGSNLIVFGRYKGEGKINVTLSGNVKGVRQYYKSKVNFKNDDEYDFIPPIWASRRIGYLLDLIRLNGESKELIDEVTLLAREFGIITPYTSYLILEDEDRRIRRNELADELQTIPPRSELKKEMKADYLRMKEKSGRSSVVVSEEFQNLNNASNYNQTRQGNLRMDYKDSDGSTKNLTQQVKIVLGRAVYQSGKFWIDSELQVKASQQRTKIQFNSDEYFNLISKEPMTTQFLALGKNVRFSFKNTLYEIFE